MQGAQPPPGCGHQPGDAWGEPGDCCLPGLQIVYRILCFCVQGDVTASQCKMVTDMESVWEYNHRLPGLEMPDFFKG